MSRLFTRAAALAALLLLPAAPVAAQDSKQYVRERTGAPSACPPGTLTIDRATGTVYSNVLGVCVAGGPASVTGPTLFTGQYNPALVNGGISGAAKTVDWNSGNVQYVTLTGNVTFTFSNPVSGGRYVLILKQDGTGSRTATWPAAVLWPGGTPPTLTTTAGKVDVITFVYEGVNSKYYGGSVLNF